MQLFNAAIYTNNFEVTGKTFAKLDEAEQKLRATNQWYLESYHYVKNRRYVNAMRKEGARVFLDSGAFSAFSLGTKIDLDK